MVRTLSGVTIVPVLRDDMADITDIYLAKKSKALARLKKHEAIQKSQRYPMQRFLRDNSRQLDLHEAKIFMDAERI